MLVHYFFGGLFVVHFSLRLVFFFFFKQKTAYEMRISDWSSDVCSSDLVDRACPADGAVGERRDPGPRPAPAVVLRADRAADDRGRQHLAVLLHPRLRPSGPVARPVRRRRPQLARHPLARARLPDRGEDLEGGGLLHDCLPEWKSVGEGKGVLDS